MLKYKKDMKAKCLAICFSVWENYCFLAVPPDHWRILNGRHASTCQLLNTLLTELQTVSFSPFWFQRTNEILHSQELDGREVIETFWYLTTNSNQSVLGPSVAHWKKFSLRLLISDHHNLISSSNVVANFQSRHFRDIASRRMGRKTQKGLMLWLACGHDKKTKWQPLKERGCNERTPTKPVGVQHRDINQRERNKKNVILKKWIGWKSSNQEYLMLQVGQNRENLILIQLLSTVIKRLKDNFCFFLRARVTI